MRHFKTIIMAAVAVATLATQPLDAQNKRERLLQTLDQSHANDYVPVFFNLHFPDKFGYKAVQWHIDFYRATNVDFVNVKYETVFPAAAIRKPADWASVKAVDEEYYEPQLKVVEGLAAELGQEALIIPTVYSPFKLLVEALGGDKQRVIELINKDPEAARPALQAAATSLVTYIRAARRRGADGFYISSQGGDAESFGANGVFLRVVREYDKQVSDAAAEVSPFNILHVCNSGFKYDRKGLDAYTDYAGSIVNVPVNAFTSDLSLQDVYTFFHRPVLGGLERQSKLYTGTLDEAKAEVDEILRTAPANFILGADDSVPNDSDWDRLRAIVDYAHTWRQTHRQ